VHEAEDLTIHVPNVMKIWYPKPSGTLWATLGLLRDSFTFIFLRLRECLESRLYSVMQFNIHTQLPSVSN